jgi:hypothetical protein
MYFQNAKPNSNNVKLGPAANENAAAIPSRAPAKPRHGTQTPKLATRGDLRQMVILATEGAIDMWVGHERSSNLDRFETLYEEHSAALAAYPERVGDTDLGFLLRRARTNFKDFRETMHRLVVQGSLSGVPEKALDEVLETVKDSAVAAAASLASIELALAKG